MRRITIVISLGTGLILVGIGVGLCAMFIFMPQVRTELVFVCAVVGGLGTLYSGLLLGDSLRERIKQAKQARAMRKQEHTMEFMATANDIRLVRLRADLESKLKPNGDPPDNFYEMILADHDLQAIVTTLLNSFEGLSIGIQSGYLDERMAYDGLRTIVPWAHRIFGSFIDNRRKKFHDDAILCELDKLVTAWQDHRSLGTGERFVATT